MHHIPLISLSQIKSNLLHNQGDPRIQEDYGGLRKHWPQILSPPLSLLLPSQGHKTPLKTSSPRTSPEVQWVRFCAFSTGNVGSICGQGTKIPYASTTGQKSMNKGKQSRNFWGLWAGPLGLAATGSPGHCFNSNKNTKTVLTRWSKAAGWARRPHHLFFYGSSSFWASWPTHLTASRAPTHITTRPHCAPHSRSTGLPPPTPPVLTHRTPPTRGPSLSPLSSLLLITLPAKSRAIEKDIDAGKNWGQDKRAAEDEMVGEHHRLNGYKCEQIPGDSEGQGSLAGCSPWGDLDRT